MCICDNVNRKALLVGIFLPEYFILIMQIILMCYVQLDVNKEKIQNIIFAETPIYNLHFLDIKPNEEAINIISFFENKERKVTSNKKNITEKENITKLYDKYFVYDKDTRNYFDYKNNYTVPFGGNCPSNYKQCGILNNEQRILCLPNSETCPLNDFIISDNNADPSYSTYQKLEVTDTISGEKKYFYYTNTEYNKRIITKFRLSKGFPCVSLNENSWIPLYSDETPESYECKTEINGKKKDERYDQVGIDISLDTIYKDIIRDYGEEDLTDKKVELYARNFIDMDEECIKKFFEEIDNDERFYDNIEKAIMGIIAVSILFNLALCIYSTLICCYYFLRFYWFFLTAPIYGILSNIVTIIIAYQGITYYECEDTGFNDLLNETIKNNYKDSRNVVVAMSAVSLFFLIIVLIFTISLKRNYGLDYVNRLVNNNLANYPVPIILNGNAAYPPQPTQMVYYNPQNNIQMAPGAYQYPVQNMNNGSSSSLRQKV